MSTTMPQLQVINNPNALFPQRERCPIPAHLKQAEPASNMHDIHSDVGIDIDIDIPDFEIATAIPIKSDQEIIIARREGRTLAEQMDFSSINATLIATSISELAHNIVHYAKSGKILLGKVIGNGRVGIVVLALDPGPGIPDTQLAVRDGFSTSGGMGLGLPGVKRIMDVFKIVSNPGNGTTVTTIKWK